MDETEARTLGSKDTVHYSMGSFFPNSICSSSAFPGTTPNDQLVAVSLFSFSWILLVVGFRRLQDGLPIPAKDLLKKFYPFDIALISPAIVFFLLHILIDSRLGWISFALFAVAQYRTIQNIISLASRTVQSGFFQSIQKTTQKLCSMRVGRVFQVILEMVH